ncbi:MAG: RelA/SpoT family protein [Patescibacteria group bacterium]
MDPLIEKAREFAKNVHKDQKRNNGEPYFSHLEATAKYLEEMRMSATTIAAGWLHDSIEDVGVEPEILEKEFGKDVRFIVEGVTKLGHIKYHGTDRYNESLRKLFVAMSQDIRVLIVKLCDRLHNMETLEFVPAEKQRRIAGETLEIYAPIAYRLGIGKLSKRLEDLAFKYVYPKEYAEISSLLKEKREGEAESLEKFRKSITKELAATGIKDFKTDFRIKGIYSLYKKYINKSKDIDKIYDIAAMRILLKLPEDCYKVLGIIHSHFQPLPGKIKDYIAHPKQNGYQGLHTTVFTGHGTVAEVQIKTLEMHREAEYGIASHIDYKNNKKNAGIEWVKRILPSFILKNKTSDNDLQKDTPEWIRELVNYQSTSPNTEDVLDDIKSDFLNTRIFVFTPKGDVIDLPKDSTPIDFAYSIHSDIGNTMSGAKINGKMSTLSTVLKNGDIVEIITKKSSKPSRKWLESAQTALAKKHIKQLS